ncbi:MAG: Holliday junction resolvase RecU [Eubacterium sp.]|nr:Holliday junction resolvase RecU [Eubacterium sp.]
MAMFNSRGLRGSALEDLINNTNERYRKDGLALVQKIPTPITPIDIDHSTSRITLAYFDKKSTVDYIGAVQGIPVAFDAKECKEDTFPLSNIHAHQMRFMDEFEKQEGIAFFLLYFSSHERFYYLRYDEARTFWERMENGGRKSFRRDELDEDFFFDSPNGLWVPYLPMIQKDLDARKE